MTKYFTNLMLFNVYLKFRALLAHAPLASTRAAATVESSYAPISEATAKRVLSEFKKAFIDAVVGDVPADKLTIVGLSSDSFSQIIDDSMAVSRHT
jgi:hypothetical protein